MLAYLGQPLDDGVLEGLLDRAEMMQELANDVGDDYDKQIRHLQRKYAVEYVGQEPGNPPQVEAVQQRRLEIMVVIM